jgi:predicted RNA-binding Zn ribbon-like protein
MPPVRPKSPFEFTGGNPCLDFADTVDNRTTGHPRELLTDYRRLLQWAEEAGVISAKTAERLRHLASHEPGQALATLRAAIQLRDAVYLIFSAVAQRRAIPGMAVTSLNKAVRQAAQHAQLVYASRRLTWEWIDPGNNLDSKLWPVSRAAAELLIGEDIGYVRQCASEDCSSLNLDKTKNQNLRTCDMKSCGIRVKSGRYYRREIAG